MKPSSNTICRVLVVVAAAAALVSARPARGINIIFDFDDFTAQNCPGIPIATAKSNFEEAAREWMEIFPDDLNKPFDHIQNSGFVVAIKCQNIDPKGDNPAEARNNAAAQPSLFTKSTVVLNNVMAATSMMYWDPTPNVPDEFDVIGSGRFRAKPNGPAANKFDMVMVLKHELGHVIGFSNAYSDFVDFVNDTWNQTPGHPKIEFPETHFASGANLMSSAAGFANGKNGRSYPQPLDIEALERAYGYMATPEPGALAMGGASLALLAWNFAARRRQRR